VCAPKISARRTSARAWRAPRRMSRYCHSQRGPRRATRRATCNGRRSERHPEMRAGRIVVHYVDQNVNYVSPGTLCYVLSFGFFTWPSSPASALTSTPASRFCLAASCCGAHARGCMRICFRVSMSARIHWQRSGPSLPLRAASTHCAREERARECTHAPWPARCESCAVLRVSVPLEG